MQVTREAHGRPKTTIDIHGRAKEVERRKGSVRVRSMTQEREKLV
jgi:hypothetical protein